MQACGRVVKKIESSRRDGKRNGRFSKFRCKIELHVFREAGAFIRVDSEMCRLQAYFDNPDMAWQVLVATQQILEMAGCIGLRLT